jgi:hypothetical protein
VRSAAWNGDAETRLRIPAIERVKKSSKGL